jgi:D-tyrosyl-tRNA(Tyr) deacylase
VRAVVQRVSHATIRVEGALVAEMGAGLLALVGVAREDGPTQACELAERLLRLRVFPDAQGQMNRSLLDTGGTLGVVSQFTLMGDARKGRRPAFTAAAPGRQAEPLLEALANAARAFGAPVVMGRFGAQMQIALVNEGPVTILLDTERRF